MLQRRRRGATVNSSRRVSMPTSCKLWPRLLGAPYHGMASESSAIYVRIAIVSALANFVGPIREGQVYMTLARVRQPCAKARTPV